MWSALAWLSLALRAMPPFLLLACALAIGALPGLPFVRQWRAPPATYALGVYGLFGFHLLLFLALRLAPPVEANLVNYLWPLLIVVLAPVMLADVRFAWRPVIAALAGFAGAALLVAGRIEADATRDLTGFVLAGGSAFVWATYSLATRRRPPFPTAVVGGFCAVSALLALACHLALEPRYTIMAGDWPALVAIGLGPMGAAFYCWDRALKDGDPRLIGTLAYLTPLASTGLLLAAGAGEWTWRTGAAAILIVGAAAWASRR